MATAHNLLVLRGVRFMAQGLQVWAENCHLVEGHHGDSASFQEVARCNHRHQRLLGEEEEHGQRDVEFEVNTDEHGVLAIRCGGDCLHGLSLSEHRASRILILNFA